MGGQVNRQKQPSDCSNPLLHSAVRIKITWKVYKQVLTLHFTVSIVQCTHQFSLFVAYTHDDLCQKIETIMLIIRDTEFQKNFYEMHAYLWCDLG